jgi:hypothetical protein
LYNNHFSFAAQELIRKLLEIVQENLILNSSAQKNSRIYPEKKEMERERERERQRSNHQIVQNVIE